jgi:predicted LPLAT superfamily acyltransferase
MSGRPIALHWAQVSEAGVALGLRLLFLVHRWFGRWPFLLLLTPVMVHFYLTRGIARRASLEYLRRAHGPAGWPARHWRSLRHFLTFGECILDKALAWSGGLALDRVQIHGLESLRARVAAGQGALILVSHLGNLEVSRALARRSPEIRMTVLAHTKHAQRFNRLLATLNRESQADLIQVTEVTAATAVMLSERIEGGELVVIAADRVPVSGEPRVVTVPFFGEYAPFPIGPYVLAGLLQCPMYLLFCLRLPDGFHLFIEPFSDAVHLPHVGREATLKKTAAHFAARLEYYCRLAPLQWFNFYEFWAPPASQHLSGI